MTAEAAAIAATAIGQAVRRGKRRTDFMTPKVAPVGPSETAGNPSTGFLRSATRHPGRGAGRGDAGHGGEVRSCSTSPPAVVSGPAPAGSLSIEQQLAGKG